MRRQPNGTPLATPLNWRPAWGGCKGWERRMADARGLEPPVARARSAPSIPQSLPRRELVTPAGRSPCRQALEHVIAAPLPPTESTRPSPGPLDDLSPGPLRRDCRGRLTGQVMGNVARQASPGRHHALNASRLAAGSLNDSMPLSGGPYSGRTGSATPRALASSCRRWLTTSGGVLVAGHHHGSRPHLEQTREPPAHPVGPVGVGQFPAIAHVQGQTWWPAWTWRPRPRRSAGRPRPRPGPRRTSLRLSGWGAAADR